MFRFPATGPDFEEQIFGPQSVRSFGAVPDAAVRLRTAAYCRDKGLDPLSPDGSHMALCQDADYLHDLRYGPGINVIRCGMAPFPTVPLADCDGTCRLFASHEALRLFLQRQARDYFRQEYSMQRLALYDVAPLETEIRSALHRTRKKPGEGITIEQKVVLPYAIPHGVFDMAPDLEHYLRFVAQNGVGHLYVTPHNRRIVQLLHIREHGRLLPELFVPAD